MAKVDYITRTMFTLKATGYAIKMEKGSPSVETVESETWTSTKKSDMPTAKRLIKAVNGSVALDSVTCTVISEDIFAQTTDEFMKHAIKVRRLANGKVEPIEETTETE